MAPHLPVEQLKKSEQNCEGFDVWCCSVNAGWKRLTRLQLCVSSSQIQEFKIIDVPLRHTCLSHLTAEALLVRSTLSSFKDLSHFEANVTLGRVQTFVDIPTISIGALPCKGNIRDWAESIVLRQLRHICSCLFIVFNWKRTLKWLIHTYHTGAPKSLEPSKCFATFRFIHFCYQVLFYSVPIVLKIANAFVQLGLLHKASKNHGAYLHLVDVKEKGRLKRGLQQINL